jgi:hypothetical protein
VNNQIISNAASFTGTVNADDGFLVGNDATSGNVLKADGISFKSSALTKSDVGLDNVDNVSDANKIISNLTASALAAKADLVSGKVPATQLPASALMELGNDSTNAYWGDKGKIAYDHSLVVVGNPHAVTKSDVGLANVDNTSDTAKPISSAVSLALTTKADLVTGKVPAEQLPPMSYSVVDYANRAAFPDPGDSNTYYVALDTMYVYLWGGDGVGYVMITGSLVIADNAVTMVKIQDIDTNTVIGRIDSGIGNPKALSASELRAIIGTVGIATDAIWDAAGDLVVGSGADAAVRLAKGSSGQVLTAGATTLSWQTPATGGGTITDVTGTSPVVSSGGTTPAISMPAATASAPGHATAAQITKLDGIEPGANDYTHPGGDGYLHVPATAGASNGQALLVDTPGAAAVWGTISSSGAVSVADTSSIDLTLSGSQISGVVLPAGVNHDSLSNYSANKHIDHSAVSVIAGTGMSGGGTLTESRTLNCTVVGYSAATARSDMIAASIADGDTTHAPDGNSVFDALALKANLVSPTFTGTVLCAAITASGILTAATIKTGSLNTTYVPYYDSTNGLSNSIIRSVASVIGIGISPTKAFLHLAAATAANANLKFEPAGVEPTSADVGSLWFYVDGGGIPYLKFKKTSSVTVDLLAMSGTSQWTTSGNNIWFGTATVGSVGVGISAPSARLHVYGTNASGLASGRFENTSTTGYCEVRVKSGTNDLYFGACSPGYTGTGFESGSWIWNTGAGKLSFGTNNTECFNINSNNVLYVSTPTNRYHQIYKTQSSVDLTVPTTNTCFSPALTGGTGQGVGWMLPIVPQVFCGTICNVVPTISGSMWYATIHSKVLNTGGIGLQTTSGSYNSAITSHIGLVHEVENKGGKSGDCSAVFHQVYMHGHLANESSESTSIYYSHVIGGFPGVEGNDGLGAYYTSVFEGHQYYMNGGSNTRGCKGWWHLLYISNNFATGGLSAGNWKSYDYISAIHGVDVATFGAAAMSGYDIMYADTFLRAAGKWHTVFGGGVASYEDATTFQLTLDVCGIDLCTNVLYSYATVPALKISDATYIDLNGKFPYTGTCKIGSVSNGIHMTIMGTSGTAVTAFGINSSATYLRINNVLYGLSVDTNGFVKATS